MRHESGAARICQFFEFIWTLFHPMTSVDIGCMVSVVRGFVGICNKLRLPMLIHPSTPDRAHGDPENPEGSASASPRPPRPPDAVSGPGAHRRRQRHRHLPETPTRTGGPPLERSTYLPLTRRR